MEPDYDEAYGLHQDDHYCVHGTYVGGWAGPDYMCGLCEDSCFTLLKQDEYSLTYFRLAKPDHTVYRVTARSFAGLIEAERDLLELAGRSLKWGMRLERYPVYAWIKDKEVEPGDNVIGTFYSRRDLEEYERED